MKRRPIDFVIPWVDGSDPEWRSRKAKYTGTADTDDREIRYRDYGTLRYWFRGIERFAPWVHKVWFICDQEPPAWLNRQHPKLRIVRHEDYLPEAYRPAFSANPIELNLHRIKGLAEQFVYFNDDTFLIRPVEETFFFKNGLPRDCAVLNPLSATELAKNGRDAHIFTFPLNDLEYLNCDFQARTCFRRHPAKWLHPCYGKDNIRNLIFMTYPRFVGFVENHLPNAYLKSSFAEAWEQDGDILDATSRHHIRNDHDVNQWLIRQRQLAAGKFIPRKPFYNCCFSIADDEISMHRMIRQQTAPMICLNDTKPTDEAAFRRIQRNIQKDFESILPAPSQYEKERKIPACPQKSR